MSAGAIRFRASKAHPCPVCASGTKGCSRTEDGLHLCRGEPQPGWFALAREPDAAGFRHYRREGERRERPFAARKPNVHVKLYRPPEPAAPARNWTADVSKFAAVFRGHLDRRERLAAELGVPAEVFERFPELIGHNKHDRAGACWTFAERDGTGNVVGIMRRFEVPPEDGRNKKRASGSKCGLFFAPDFDRAGDVDVVEGHSDVLALTAAGLNAVGRPNNTGGADLLADLLRDVPRARRVTVWGENDLKENGTWPGREGAERVAGALRAALGRDIEIRFPPAGAKDVRAYLTAAGGAWPDRGRALLKVTAPKTKPPKYTFTDAADFLALEHRVDWLADWLLVRGQPGCIVGPVKTLKTSIELDLAVSLATATPVLGEWRVGQRVRTAVVSGESGGATLKETTLRILRARGLDAEDVRGWLRIETALPSFADVADLVDFGESLARSGSEVLILDPLYLTLGGAADPKSMFEMGALLRQMHERLAASVPGVTVLLVHHANRALPTGEPMELQHIAYAGLEQFARQWLLLSRKTKYAGDGRHELWLSYGGSAGASGLKSLTVEEGTLGPDSPGRTWKVQLSNATEARAEETDERKRARADKAREANAEDDRAALKAIDKIVKAGDAPTENAVRLRAELGLTKARAALLRLEGAGAIEKRDTIVKSGKGRDQTAAAYYRTEGE